MTELSIWMWMCTEDTVQFLSHNTSILIMPPSIVISQRESIDIFERSDGAEVDIAAPCHNAPASRRETKEAGQDKGVRTHDPVFQYTRQWIHSLQTEQPWAAPLAWRQGKVQGAWATFYLSIALPPPQVSWSGGVVFSSWRGLANGCETGDLGRGHAGLFYIRSPGFPYQLNA